MMRTRERKGVGFVLAVLAVMALFIGVAAAYNGYGVGDGSGPVGTQPEDGTGEQHRGPAGVVVDDLDAEEDGILTETPTTLQDRDRDQLRTQDLDQLRTQDQLRTHDRLHEPDGDCDGDQLREQLHEQLRLHAS